MKLHVRPRYYRFMVDPGVEWTEANTRYAWLDWSLPVEKCALILVDVWDYHYLKSTLKRTDDIMRNQMKPLIDACRKHGLQIIHAPAPPLAKQFPQWVGHREDDWKDVPRVESDRDEAWPPKEFRTRSGPYAAYGRPQEPRADELEHGRRNMSVHPLALPQEGDVVVATGDELHRVCKQSGILFLFFAGFNTNACILERDYGLRAMGRRGYAVILVRDCTTAMESHFTEETLGQTNGAILQIEMFLGYTVTSHEIVTGFSCD